jgi:hypothetical protein
MASFRPRIAIMVRARSIAMAIIMPLSKPCTPPCPNLQSCIPPAQIFASSRVVLLLKASHWLKLKPSAPLRSLVGDLCIGCNPTCGIHFEVPINVFLKIRGIEICKTSATLAFFILARFLDTNTELNGGKTNRRRSRW